MNDGYLAVLDEIASLNPTPGGGSVAALTLAHAQSLALMVARLTLAKEKWISGHAISEEIVEHCEKSINFSISLAKEDAEAFDKVMMAYKKPKSDDSEIEARKEAILLATIEAASTPSTIASESKKLLEKLPALAKLGNSNAITDLAASAELAHSAAYIAYLNVKINVGTSDNEELQKILQITIESLSESKVLITEIQDIVLERMG
jgi:formiminotetrahydrofolate cyclodeaminase